MVADDSGAGAPVRCHVGIGIPNYGGAPTQYGFGQMAKEVEDRGFGGVWLSDHVVLPAIPSTPYPYSGSGEFFTAPDDDWFDPFAVLSYMAATTTRLKLGVGVAVAPLRDPRILAKQLATIDSLSDGRVILGVGTGWLKEEYDALEVPYAGRGARLDGSITLMRQCWSGKPIAGDYGPYRIPEGVRCFPTPVQGDIPILIGGNGSRSRLRAAEVGDGWYAAASSEAEGGLNRFVADKTDLLEQVERHGRNPADVTIALRVAVNWRTATSGELERTIRGYAAAGVQMFSIDFAWRRIDDVLHALDAVARWAPEVAVVSERV